jgi:protein gp37
MNKTAIEWTDYSSNPIHAIDKATGKRGWHCTKKSPGCAHCYAETLNKRWGTGRAYTPANDGAVEWVLNEQELAAWATYEQAVKAGKKPPMNILIGDMTDLFHPDVPARFIDNIWWTMVRCPHITFQVLTKRPERLRAAAEAWANLLDGPRLNIWLGTSVENQHWADVRIPTLVGTPAAVHFLSMEPLLGAVILQGDGEPGRPDALCRRTYLRGIAGDQRIQWVIVGGESGAQHRPFNPAWAANIRDQCQAAGVPFLFKQHGGRTPKAGGRLLDGQEYNDFPAVAA